MRFQALLPFFRTGSFAAAMLFSLVACKGPWVKEFKQEKRAPNVDSPMFAPIPTLNLPASGGPKTINVTLTDADSYLPCNQAISTVSSDITVVPATYMAVSGVAPNCMVTITPAPGVVGTSTITLSVTDGKNISSQSFTVNSYGVPSASVTPVPLGIINVAHTAFTVSGNGGLPPYTYSLASGSLPAGMSINASTGVVSGTPTDYGKFSNIIFRATDSGGGSATTTAFDLYIASYNLSFTNSPSPGVDPALPTGVTVTRSSAGSRIGANGLIEYTAFGKERFEYEPSASKVNRGLLIEEKRANLFRTSERFDAPYAWAPMGLTLSSTLGNAPDGKTTAQLFKETATTAPHGFSYSFSKGTNPLNLTFSIFLRGDGRTKANIRLGSGTTSYAQALCVLSGTGTSTPVTSLNGGFSVTASSLTAFPGGWYRCSVSVITDGVDTVTADIRMLDGGTAESYLGSTAGGIYFWGAQLEAARTPSSYIPARNLLTMSEQFNSSSGWNLSGASSTATIAGPFGSGLATEVNDSTGSNLGVMARSYAITSTANDYTISTYVAKRTTNSALAIIADTVVTEGIIFPTDVTYSTGIAFDAKTGSFNTATRGDGDPPAAVKVESINSNYWRIAFTMKSKPNNKGSLRFSFYPAWARALSGGASTSSENNGNDSAFVWGFQVEPGYNVATLGLTPYFRMTTATERDPDLVEFPLSNGPFNYLEGTAVSSVSIDTPSLSAPALCFSDGTSSNKMTHRYSTGLASVDTITSGGSQSSLTQTASIGFAKLKLAAAYKYNDSAIALNGVAGSSLPSISIPVTNQIRFGRVEENNQYLNGHLRSFLYYNARVPNAYLPTLSLSP